jgi:uncharacterized membrane protein YkgB
MLLSALNRRRIALEDRFFLFLKKISLPVCRGAFFLVFSWFGLLKMLSMSPAQNVIHTIYSHTMPFVPWSIFIFFFAAYEILIGFLFLFPGKEKYALLLLVPDMVTTFGPLVLMPALTWKSFLVPNLIGQYIMKNVVIIALAIFLAAYQYETRLNQTKPEAEGERVLKKQPLPV